MESYSTFIGIAIVLIILIPLFLIQKSQNSQKKKSKKGFILEAKNNNLNISDIDSWGTYYTIAIDEAANKLIYSKIIDAEHKVTIVDLSQVDSCEIVKTHRPVKNKTTYKTETDKIDLLITYKTKAKDVLEFYNIDVNFQMSNEIALLNKWEEKIKSNIVKKAHAA
ncbi:hypothetical protein OS188_06905 [Xanthomarina sp. F1114]|uniref:hypothetical protein n=1 Tax=Xanthomarina sp. F1114 TaxID=2996019 RepID=UPI00225DFEF2|nr:hypothetical protein [Xanthomarina sp. F1114]MCX7547676.1 hypothetical protein [Xanthomarina sp. F1114]